MQSLDSSEKSAPSTSLQQHQPPWLLEESEGDVDDDWFYDSIRRYEQLCIYNLSCRVRSLDVSPDGSMICLAGVTGDRNEVLVFGLPMKLLVDCPVQEGLLHKRDFALMAGGGQDRRDENDHVRQVMFLDSNRVLLLAGNEMSIWGIKEGTDLMLKVKHRVLNGDIISFRMLKNSVVAFGRFKIWRLDSEDLSVLTEQDTAVSVQDAIVSEDEVLQLGHTDGTISARKFDTLEEDETLSMRVGTAAEGEESLRMAFSSCLVAACSSEGCYLIVSDRVNEARIEDEMLSSCSDLQWVEGEARSHVLVATCGDKIGVYSYDADAAEDDKLTKLFCHDGHRAQVTCCVGHKKVPRLFFSADASGAIHAWLFEKSQCA